MFSDAANILVYTFLFISLYFEVFLLVTFLEKFSFASTKSPAGRKKRIYPSVTIIVPCFNEEATLQDTVKSLLALDYPKKMLSLFVIDDGSTDRTWEIMQQFSGHPQVRLFKKENGGKHTVLNFGISQTQSDLVGCLDADSFVDPRALKEIVRYFDDPKTMAVTPAIKIHDPRGPIQLIQKAEYLVSIFLRRSFAFIDALFVTPGPFSIFRRSVFDQIGGYRKAHNTEDLEMALRMQRNHLKIENAHTAYVYTVAPNTFYKLYKQRTRWTYGFLKNALDYRFMFFRKEYGNLGLFTLPMGFISIFSALFFFFSLLTKGVVSLFDQVVRFQTVGWWIREPEFDLFFLNTHAVLLLAILMGVVTLVFMMIGKQVSREKHLWTIDVPLFLVFYGFLVPWWLMRAVFNTLTSREGTWRQ